MPTLLNPLQLVVLDHRGESRRNNFSEINMAKISGVYLNGFGEPVAGVQLVLTARATSASVITTTTAQQITGVDGSYSFDVLAGVYVVTASGAYLGVITVGTDSPDGTLNDYLAGYDPSVLTPEIVQTVEELVKEAQEAASAAQKAADEAKAAAAAVSTPEPYIPPAWDAPGSTIFGYYYVDSGEAYLRPGSIVAATKIYVGNVTMIIKNGDPVISMNHTQQPSGGTWQLQGSTSRNDTDSGVTQMRSALAFLRIDTAGLLTTKQLRADSKTKRVRNCSYANPEGTAIDCEVNTVRGWLPFTASRDDSTEWGPKIYAAAVAGKYGEVLACVN